MDPFLWKYIALHSSWCVANKRNFYQYFNTCFSNSKNLRLHLRKTFTMSLQNFVKCKFFLSIPPFDFFLSINLFEYILFVLMDVPYEQTNVPPSILLHFYLLNIADIYYITLHWPGPFAKNVSLFCCLTYFTNDSMSAMAWKKWRHKLTSKLKRTSSFC